MFLEASETQAETRYPNSDVTVIGAGPVGIRCAQELARCGLQVTVLSNEAVSPYNRVRLTPVLGGDVQFSEIGLMEDVSETSEFELHLGQRVVKIDRAARHVITADGGVWPYGTLVLATGSRAFVPSIPGRDLAGIFTFRTADDASALIARSFSARNVVVIGGGLLGLEAARGMRRRQCNVTVLEPESHLMPRQLDKPAGTLPGAQIKALGITIKAGQAVRGFLGDTRVTGVALADGETLPRDTVILCTGVRANIDLARQSGLSLDRGITVDATMQTSDPSIYAVGECAEHQGQVFGLVDPGYAQAEVAAAVIAGEPRAFEPAAPSSRLKV